MSELRISDYYKPFPRQAQFHQSNARYRLFGGAAGPGKTKALLWEAIFQANHYPKVDTLLLRRTFPELEESLLREFRRNVPRELYASFNDSKHVVTWNNGSTTRFGYCQSANDVYQYQGAEYLFIGIDELTHFMLKQWQFLTSRNRCPVAGTFPNMAGATNPGNIGHAWVKAMFIDGKAPAGMERSEQYDKADYEFIKATIADNPIYANDAEYRKVLNALPSHLRAAFLNGDWDVFAGQYFDVFEPVAHVVSRPQILSWYPKWISIDWGYEHPSAVLWHAEDEHGVTYTYRELSQNHLTPEALANKIVELCSDEKIQIIYLSPDAFAKRTDESTIASQISDILRAHKLPECALAANDRIGGWMCMYGLLDAGRWLIADSCVNLIEMLPQLTRDPDNIEDVLKMDGDDVPDSARYGLYSRYGSVKVPVPDQIDRKIAAAKITEPTSEMIWRSKFAKDFRRQAQPIKFGRRHFRNN